MLSWQASGGKVRITDGSVVQHDWVQRNGFKRSNVNAAKLERGRVRIAFLRPQDSRSRLGHVALIYNGCAYKSYGGSA